MRSTSSVLKIELIGLTEFGPLFLLPVTLIVLTRPNEAEIDLDEDKEQFGSVRSNSRAISNGVVGAIVRTARNLPENVTLGDSLGDFDGRICEEVCRSFFFMEELEYEET
ncbi:hypothetical protein SDJN02_25037, partial [Cucurbita argyrosperma subsp. argyrosperma]